MGLFDRFKEANNFISKLSNDLFKCNICGMLSKNQQSMQNHVAGFHSEYVFYKRKYGKIPDIATTTWINIYYRILYMPPLNWSDKQVELAASTNKGFIMNVTRSIRRVVIDGKTIGYVNPVLGVNPLFNSPPLYGRRAYILLDPINGNTFPVSREVFESISKGTALEYPFRRVHTVKSTPLNGNQKLVEFLIRFREGGWNGLRLEDKKIRTKEILPTERITYGYSPLDFIPDANMFIELDKALTKAFNIVDFKFTTVTVFFDETGEPCVQARIGGTLYVEHRIVDRIKLAKEAPEIEKACFGDKGLTDFIEFEKNYVEKNKGKDTETIKEWLNAVNKLMKIKT